MKRFYLTKVDVIAHVQTGRMWLDSARHMIKSYKKTANRRHLDIAEMYVSLAEDNLKTIRRDT